MQAMCYRRYGGPEVLWIETVAAPTPGIKTCTHAVHNVKARDLLRSPYPHTNTSNTTLVAIRHYR